MQTERIILDPTEAREKFRDYKKHQHWSAPIDAEIQRVYQLISQGRTIIKALESITAAGLGDDRLPKLAIARADAKECWLDQYYERSTSARGVRMTTKSDAGEHTRNFHFDFAPDAFPGLDRQGKWTISSMVPLIPLPLRPKRALQNYHILYEAEWRRTVPIDPMLLRRIGTGDMWLVCAAWDLTEVERAALSSRLNG